MTSRLTFSEGNHTYWLADEAGKKRRAPSVSALKRCLHQFGGDRWYIGETAAAVADHWPELHELPPPSRRDEIVRLGMTAVGAPADFGRAVHHYCEQMWTGEPVEVPDLYAGHVQAVADWFRANVAGVLQAERMCWAGPGDSGESPMAGRFDLIIRTDQGVGLLDLKSWQAGRSGQPKPAEWAFQLAAYAGMEHMVIDDEDTPMPHIDWCGVLHVGPGTARLYTLPEPDRDRAWEQVQETRALKNLPGPKMKEHVA